MKPTITLLTDFGTRDPYVAVLKGVILSISPDATLVDVSHDVPAHDVQAAAFLLAEVCRWYPPGTVHLAVVDPGVGSERPILAGSWAGQIIVAPDNGLVSLVQARQPAERLHHVIRRPPAQISSTFHGRDLLAPVAARLACGLELAEVGPAAQAPQMLVWPQPSRRGSKITGVVLAIDHFGNLITNLGAAEPRAFARPRVHIGERTITGLVHTYSSVRPGEVAALIGSMDTLEIAVNQGSAAQVLGAKVGDEIVCEPGGED